MRCSHHVALILPLLALTGCPATQPPAKQQEIRAIQAGQLDTSGSTPTDLANSQPAGGNEARDSGPSVVSLDVYQLSVPLGSISRSEEFWKRVEESSIDVGTYDLLLKNSVRVGIGDNKDWPFFKSLIDNNHASVLQGASSVAAQGSLQLRLKDKIPSETVSWITDRDVLFMRDFDACENLVNVSFEPALRTTDHAIVCVCPLVKGERKVVRFTPLNKEEPPIQMVYPEQLMSLAVKADVPPDHFMILSPTPDLGLNTSFGRSFFVRNGFAEPLETVLILSPHIVHLTPARP